MDSNKSPKVVYLTLGIIVSALTVGSLSILSARWEGLSQATCVPNCFCEAVRPNGPLRQPVNTWSSIAFILAGTWLFAVINGGAKKHGPRFENAYAKLLAICSIIIGIGSAFLHASLTLAGQFLDVLGMYLLATFMLLYACERLILWRTTSTFFVFVILNVGLAILLITVPESRRYVFAILIVLAVLLEVMVRRYRKPHILKKWWNAGLALLSLAYVIWILDNQRVLCWPYSLIQGHSIWHISGAIAIILLYNYYASESRNASNH